ncbi:hypothetical protein ACF0H5_015471 [Mactra antiquata]
MMWLFLVALTVFAVHESSAQPKDVCFNATMRHGIGYNPHPFECSMFVQCFYVGDSKKPSSISYRKCEFGDFWDQSKLKCLESYKVDCPHDKCKIPGTKFYKYADPKKCVDYYHCIKGRAYGNCCPEGQGFHHKRGCIPTESCKAMCSLRDRVPGCKRRPISGAPTHYEQYVGDGVWVKDRCPAGNAYNPSDCDCTITGVIKVGRTCKPDLVLTFDDGKIVDTSGNNNRVRAHRVKTGKGAAYFGGGSRIVIDPLKPSQYDEGVLIIKMRYREYMKKGDNSNALQAMFTNGHCTKKQASVLIAKHKHFVLLGAEAKRKGMKKSRSRSFPLPTVDKPWKEVIYIKDDFKLEGRVCGASFNNWCTGDVVDTGCGYQIGAAKGMRGYVGLLDDIYIYRCKPLDAVINMNY